MGEMGEVGISPFVGKNSLGSFGTGILRGREGGFALVLAKFFFGRVCAVAGISKLPK